MFIKSEYVQPSSLWCQTNFSWLNNFIFWSYAAIKENASHGQTTYVHCKAGRGRSTTIVICYLVSLWTQMKQLFFLKFINQRAFGFLRLCGGVQVQYKQMTPDEAYKHVKSIRPRVLLASSQWQVFWGLSTLWLANFLRLFIMMNLMNSAC